MENEAVFNLEEAANELIAESETPGASPEITETEGQSQANPEQAVTEEDPREILSKLGQEAQGEADHSKLLEQINQIGAIHNGMPISINDAGQLKEIIQKGFDYTKKTMAHAEEVKAKTEEFAKLEASYKEKETALVQREQGMQELVSDNNIITSLLTKWQSSDPELFAYIQNAYAQEMNQFKMQQPVLAKYDGELGALKKEIESLRGQKQSEELNSIRQGWEKELGDVQGKLAGSLTKLGVKVDWEKVKSAWTADASNKMSVEDALYAAYGKDIATANQSYQKLLATKNKAQASKIHRTGVGSGQKGASGDIAIKAGDYESLLRELTN